MDTETVEAAQSKLPRCPGCWKRDVQRSRSRGLKDVVARAFSLVPFRCRACQRRFYSRTEATNTDVETT
jgi:hypothetical protein